MTLALIRLRAVGNAGDLHMADQRQMPLKAADEIALHDLRVITIEHDLHVGAADLLDDRGRLLHMVQKIAGLVAVIDRFEQQGHRGSRCLVGREFQILDERALGGAVRLGRHHARHAVNGIRADLCTRMKAPCRRLAGNSVSRPGSAANPKSPAAASPTGVFRASIVMLLRASAALMSCAGTS